MLDKQYVVVMTFHTLSKDLYSLKQGFSKNVAELWYVFCTRSEILQLEYPGRILLEHMKEMKCNCFYGGLNPKYQQMLAHKEDGEHPASNSDLLLTAQKLQRQAEGRDPPPPKMAATKGSDMTHSQMPGNSFTLCNLKGNHTFATEAVTIRNDMTEEDPGVKLEGEGETEPSANKDVEASGRVGETDKFVKYIINFTKGVEFYQKKNKNCFGCGSPDHLIQDISRCA